MSGLVDHGQTRPRTRFDDVLDFTRAVCEGKGIGTTPAWPDEKTVALRAKLVSEEYGEFIVALMNLDICEVADALADLAYVIEGTAIAFGIDMDAIWAEVHASNMAKAGGEVREDGKRLKPKNWFPPDIAGTLLVQPSIQERP